jgi:dTDP-D-glucose 4,6-dehydratase
LEVSAAKAARQLDWRPIVPPQKGLDSTVQWYVESGEARARQGIVMNTGA